MLANSAAGGINHVLEAVKQYGAKTIEPAYTENPSKSEDEKPA